MLEEVVDCGADRSQWRTQCVRDRSQERRLQLVALPECFGAAGLSQEPGSLEGDGDQTRDSLDRSFFKRRRHQDQNTNSPDSYVKRGVGQLLAGESGTGGLDSLDFTGIEDAGE